MFSPCFSSRLVGSLAGASGVGISWSMAATVPLGSPGRTCARLSQDPSLRSTTSLGRRTGWTAQTTERRLLHAWMSVLVATFRGHHRPCQTFQGLLGNTIAALSVLQNIRLFQVLNTKHLANQAPIGSRNCTGCEPPSFACLFSASAGVRLEGIQTLCECQEAKAHAASSASCSHQHLLWASNLRPCAEIRWGVLCQDKTWTSLCKFVR